MSTAPVVSKLKVYRDSFGEWRWHAVSGNNVDIVADSGEGYANHGDCRRIAVELFPGVPVDDEHDATST